jgi:hypothetical protein
VVALLKYYPLKAMPKGKLMSLVVDTQPESSPVVASTLHWDTVPPLALVMYANPLLRVIAKGLEKPLAAAAQPESSPVTAFTMHWDTVSL